MISSLLWQENERVDEQLTLVALASLLQYPLQVALSTALAWVGREDMETELRLVITTHATGFTERLSQSRELVHHPHGTCFDMRDYVEIGMLSGTSGIGKVRVTRCHFSSVVGWCVLVTPARYDFSRLEHCTKWALVGRPSSNKRART